MKALFILNSLANIGGVERMIIDKVNYMAANGWDVLLVTYEQGLHPVIYKLHASVRLADLMCPYYTLYRYSMLRRLWEYLRLKRVFRQRLNSIIQEHQTQLVITTTYCDEFLADILAVCHPKVKTIIESHTAYAHDMVPHRLRERINLYLKLRNVCRFDLLIALTESDAKSWRQHDVNVKVVPNHVVYYPEIMPESPRKEGRIIAVGRLHKQKRFDRLIDAFSFIASKYPHWCLDIYGRGTEKDALLKLIESRKLSKRIRVHEPVDDISFEYLQSQFLVLSSDYEGFGLVIVESMACGIPVVSTDCPYGPAEIIENGVTGLLCQMDSHDLALKIEWMIVHDAERRRMGIAARKSAAKYKKEHILGVWENVYLSVFENKGDE